MTPLPPYGCYSGVHMQHKGQNTIKQIMHTQGREDASIDDYAAVTNTHAAIAMQQPSNILCIAALTPMHLCTHRAPHALPNHPFIPCTEVHPKVWLSFRMASVHGYTRDSATPVPAGSTALCVCPSVCIPPGASMQRNQAPLTFVTSFRAKQADFPSQAKLPPTSKPFA